MVNISRILHPTNFSENSKLALQHACVLAEQFSAELHLLFVVTEASIKVAPSVKNFIPDEYRDEIKQEFEDKLKEFSVTENLIVVRKTVEGKESAEIIQYAKDNKIDLIVMSTHGRSGLSKILIGSVSYDVVRKSKCSVLTIYPDG